MRSAIAILAAALLLAGCGPAGEGPPPPPSLGAADRAAAERYRAWQQESAEPAVILTAAGPARPTPGGTRIGGPVWLARGEPWPADRAGEPMTFLAQVDFAALPHLEDYPERGVLQFFIGRGMSFGADFSRPDKGEFKVVWRPDFHGSGSLRRGRLHGRNGTDFYAPITGVTVHDGVALKGTMGTTQPTWLSWQFARDLPDIAGGQNRRGLELAVIAQNEAHENEKHHLGGHPQFTQDDWRRSPEQRAADRVLLNLWSDDAIMWGDMGQGQFLIRREDLLKRDFSKVYYSWDCS